MHGNVNNHDHAKIKIKWQDKVKRGLLRMIILRMFQEKDKDGENILLNGFTIRDKIKLKTNNSWEPSPGSVYPILGEMKQDGIIIEETSSNKKNRDYRLTEFGKQIYDNIIKEVMFSHDQNQNSPIYFKSKGFISNAKMKYENMNIKDLKFEFEMHKSLTEILKKLLEEKIISDPEI